MKITNILTAALVLLFAFSLNQVEAQNDKKVKITIKTDKNGVKEVIKKEFDGESNELLQFLEEYGIDIEIDHSNKELLEIIVDRSEFDNGGAERMGNHFIHKFGGECGSKAFLGIHMDDQDGVDGVEITKVVEGTGAEDAGLLDGDILISIDGEKTNSYDAVSDKILSLDPGTEIKLAILRDGKKKNIKATLGEKQNDFKAIWAPDCEKIFEFKHDEDNSWNEAPSRAFFGVSSGGISPDGVNISHVTKGSSAEKIGVQDDDIITSFNGETVENFGDLSDLISETSPGDAIEVTLLRDGQNVTVNGEMGEQNRSSCEDRVFKFEDMGGFSFDFDGEDFDEEEFEQSMHELKERLELRLDGLEDMEFDFDFDDNNDNTSRSMTVIVLLEDLSQEECNKVNENAEHKISPSNTLELDDVNFYPNPNNGIFNLEFETVEEGDMTLNIYDQNGKTVYKEMLTEFEGDYRNRIDISNRANGAYYLQIIQNGQTFNKKILKQ